jgi:hypothetical protein
MGAIAFDPNDATHNTLWAGTGRFSNGRGDGEQQIGLLKTTEGGNTWVRMGQNQLTGESIENVVPTTTTVAGKEVVLVAGDNNGVWRSTDGGASFVNMSDGAPNHLPFAAGASQLVGDPGDASRFYVGIPGQGVFITNDAGATWSPANGSGAGMPTKLDSYTNAGGGGVQDIALDPNNWRDAFVLDINGKVWETPDAGVTWNNLTGNLGSFTTDLRTVAVVETSGGRALLVGGDGAVYRDINPSTSSTSWLKFGTGLPNSIVKDIEYNATDDVLLAGTWGRGAWTVSNASASILVPGVLQITGDTDFSGEDDKIKLVIDGNNPSLLDVFLNSNLTQVQLATIQQINVDGLAAMTR